MSKLDLIPLFKIKPISITPVETKLVPKQKTEQQTSEIIKNPTTVVESVPIELPEIYNEYRPLASALNNTEIKSKEAKAAVIAQMGLERGWKAPSDNNYGNITVDPSWNGEFSLRGDKDAKGNPITQKFKVYKTTDAFVSDYMDLLKRVYPEAYSELLSDNFDINKFSNALISGKFKYAEDPEYKQKVGDVYNSVIKNINNNQINTEQNEH